MPRGRRPSRQMIDGKLFCSKGQHWEEPEAFRIRHDLKVGRGRSPWCVQCKLVYDRSRKAWLDPASRARRRKRIDAQQTEGSLLN